MKGRLLNIPLQTIISEIATKVLSTIITRLLNFALHLVSQILSVNVI